MKADTASDLICIAAACVLGIMTAMSIMESQRATYEINTGIFCAFMCLVPMIFRRAKILTLPLTFVVVIEIAIFLHSYGVLLMRYDDVVTWDTVTHLISSITVALCIFYALMAINNFDPRLNITRKWMPLFIFLITLTFSAYWESFEFLVDELWDTNMQYSPWDTIRDLTCDILGATIVSIYAYLYLGRRSPEEFIEGINIHPSLRKLMKSRG